MEPDKTADVIRELTEDENFKSEFGKGCTYCLGLFLQHTAMHNEMRKTLPKQYAGLWFNGASDHVYDMQIPDHFPEWLKARLMAFKTLCLEYGHGKGLMEEISHEAVDHAIREALDILRDIDAFMLEVPTKQGDVE